KAHGLMKRHVTKALTIGCINHAVLQTLRPIQASTVSSNQAEREATRKAKVIATKLRTTALMMNQLQAHAYEIIALDIATIINSAGSSSSSGTHSSAQFGFSSDQIRDLDNLVNDINFYYNLGTLLLNGNLGPASEYERLRRAPKRTISTRRTSVENAPHRSQEDVPKPHALRAFEQYQAKTGFLPFNLRDEISPSSRTQSSSQASSQMWTSSSVSSQAQSEKYTANAVRLSMRAVKSAIRGHYIGSKFPGKDDRDENTNAICYFFQHNL
ncbi:hypothetical protein BGX28_002010, partial [Mortierella sp. GBA30]